MTPVSRCAWSLVVLVALAAPPVQAAGEPEIDGMYASKGLNPDGSEYRGFVHIVRRGDSFLVSWMFPEATTDAVLLVPTSVGVGVVSGGMLAVSYFGQRMAGVALYEIGKGDILAGHWTVAGDNGSVYSETLTKLPGVTVEPETPETREAPPPPSRPARPFGQVL